MTPPVRPAWDDGEHVMLVDALADAKHRARLMERTQVVCLRVGRHGVEYEVLLQSSYAAIPNPFKNGLAVIARVEADGTVALDPALNPDGSPV